MPRRALLLTLTAALQQQEAALHAVLEEELAPFNEAVRDADLVGVVLRR